MIDLITSKLFSKKFFAFLLIIAALVGLVMLKKIDGVILQNVLSIVAPLYFGSDMAQNAFKSKYENERLTKTHRPSPLEDEDEPLE